MIEKGALFPSTPARDLQDRPADVADFNQKSHVVLIVGAGMPEAAFDNLKAEANSRQKTWDWLYAKVLLTNSSPNALPAGVYAIDRYGRFIQFFPQTADVWNAIEKEFIYHEARHC